MKQIWSARGGALALTVLAGYVWLAVRYPGEVESPDREMVPLISQAQQRGLAAVQRACATAANLDVSNLLAVEGPP